jgi:hypothetical protein
MLLRSIDCQQLRNYEKCEDCVEEIRLVTQELIRSISICNSLEKDHIHFACFWISSGVLIFRIDGALRLFW